MALARRSRLVSSRSTGCVLPGNCCYRERAYSLWAPPAMRRRGRSATLEPLLRFDHPTLVVVSPSRQIPIAEIDNHSARRLRSARRIANRLWQFEGHTPMRVAVNITSMQFPRTDFPIRSRRFSKGGSSPRIYETRTDGKCGGQRLRLIDGTVAKAQTKRRH
jgi:EAL domain-containing protein (putative c-di-GMP-specific phosphodiesterase class I)